MWLQLQKNCNGEKKIEKATKNDCFFSTDMVVVYIRTKCDCQCHIYLLLVVIFLRVGVEIL